MCNTVVHFFFSPPHFFFFFFFFSFSLIFSSLILCPYINLFSPGGKYISTSAKAVDMDSITDCKDCVKGGWANKYFRGSGSSTTWYGASSCYKCPAGYYSDSAISASCKDCAAGKYLPNNAAYVGHIAETNCTQCIIGKYQYYRGQGSCDSCPQGWYQGTKGRNVCTQCNYGQYTNQNAQIKCRLCPEGWQQPNLQKNYCDRCPRGRFNDQTGLRYCNKKCPPGRYGDAETLTLYSQCKLCSAGKYFAASGATADSECVSCFLCLDFLDFLVVYECINKFIPFYILNLLCILFFFFKTLCGAGQYSTETGCNNYIEDLAIDDSAQLGTTTTPIRQCLYSCALCDKGKWSSEVGATKHSACRSCPLGKFLDRRGQKQLAACKNCPLGRYGTTTSAISGIFRSDLLATQMCSGCSEGKYNQELGKTSESSCKDCGSGKWLETHNDKVPGSNVGEADCKLCRAGRYGDETGLTYTTQQIDVLGNEIHTKYCKACGSGKYLTEKGSSTEIDCVLCERGKFSVPTGADTALTCHNCPAGYYDKSNGGLQQGWPKHGGCKTRVGAGEIGSVACMKDADCSDWSACLNVTFLTNSSTCTACAIGLYSEKPGISKAFSIDDDGCKNCPRGKYNPKLGASSEDEVRTTSNPSKTFCNKCKPGHYQDIPGQSSYQACQPCPRGTYAREAQKYASDCDLCPLGRYSKTLSTWDTPISQVDQCVECGKVSFFFCFFLSMFSYCKL